ncbi:MAG TPA: VWA domain-containing protein [Vicinamibacterales bacterium]|nr:VWA domain-containing protein [Vicinamibacterales bacterium]
MDGQAHRLVFVSVCVAAAIVAATASGPRAQTGGQTPPPQQTPQQTPPVFKTATNFVQVDVYPTRDGQIVEGLSAKDFQILEDGKPQAVDTFEFIRIEPNTPEAFKRDPNTQEEANKLAADPRNRVFVLYLDHYQASLSGSKSIKEPLIAMLNRILTPGDLFGVATALMRPRDLILGRQTTSLEAQLTENWTWGLQKGSLSLREDERYLITCYGEAVAAEISQRLHEEETLKSLSGWVRYLGALRESRKAFIVFSIGWELYGPDPGRLSMILDKDHYASRPRVGITQTGTLSTTPGDPGVADWTRCGTAAASAFQVDDPRRFRELIADANRYNVAFYPINVDGLTPGGDGRWERLRELADNTDGLISNTNDFGAALRKVSDDVSAYYLLGYSSSNTKQDGTYRKIEVKTTAPGLRIKARRGYLAPAADTRSMGATAPAKAAPPEAAAVTTALNELSKLRASADVFTYGVPTPTDLAVVVELPSAAIFDLPWSRGADVQITGGGSGEPIAARIDPGQRSVLVRVPKPAGEGPFRLIVKLSAPGTLSLTDRLEIPGTPATVVGEPIVFRATPAPASPLKPAADSQFYRTERVHIEWPILGPLDQRMARLLGRDARALAVPVNLTERDRSGQAMVVADLNLAPLAVGDYVIELVASSGANQARKYLPIRVIR